MVLLECAVLALDHAFADISLASQCTVLKLDETN
jgi:hypothetical protein